MRCVKQGLWVLAMCVMLAAVPACRSSAAASRTGLALDTVVSITVKEAAAGTDTEAVLDACFAEIARLETLLSVTSETGDVARVNASAGETVTVAEETADLLQLCLDYAALSDGAFDVTVRPVTQLWDFQQGVIPDAESLAAAAATVDYRHLTVNGTAVTLTEGAVDLGGIAKGYIADRVCELLKEHGVTSALIDLGGNIVACGSNGAADWRIGIKNPAQTDTLCAVVTGREFSVVTSGVYERGFTRDGVRYHHLLSPETGMPVQNGLASVTVVCADSVRADALSTACFVMGEEAALPLLDSLDGTEALFVRQDGTPRATEGLSYILC